MTRFGRPGSTRPLVLRWAVGVVLVGGLAVTTAGCGGDDGGSAKNKVASGGGTAAGDTTKAGGKSGSDKDGSSFEQMVGFASCMRENGIDMPDPQQGEGGAMRMPAMTMDGDMSKTENAMKACEKYRPKNDYDPNDPKYQEWQAKRAACLRENGVENMDDGPGVAAVTIDAGDDKVMKAMQICDKKVPPFEKKK